MNKQNKRYPQLNLPPVNVKILNREEESFISCRIRKKELVLTPEEWVRQHLLAYLIDELSYPESLINVERLIKVNDLNKRWDIMIFNKKGEESFVIECKRPEVEIDKKTLEQGVRYLNSSKSTYLLLSNGLKHYLFKKEKEEIIAISSFPNLSDL